MSETPPANVSYANHQEDLEVLKFFAGAPGVFVEAGANHPVQGSQTYLLEQHGWHGVLIEPNPDLARLCRGQRPGCQVFECALVEPGGPQTVGMRIPGHRSHAQASIVDTDTKRRQQDAFFECASRTLDSVLEEAGVGSLDFFSIDLEGYEAPALRGFSWTRWQPRLLSVEDHCESLATHRLVQANGYKLIRRIGDNHWYVPEDAPHHMGLPDRFRFIRKMYLSMPLRKARRLSRALRGKEGI